MRWLYHLAKEGIAPGASSYGPTSLDGEGFVHCSYLPDVVESARLYFAGVEPVVLQIDPRRLDVRVEVAATPRGPMPHVLGRIPTDAVHATLSLADLERAPDRVTGTRFAFVAFEGMTLLDLVGVLDPLSRLASMGFDPASSTTIVAADRREVWSTDGASLRVEGVRPPLEAFDVLVVAGGMGTRALERDRAVLAWLETFPANRLVASVCTGAFLLGACGRLRGLRATTHHRHLERLAEHGATPVEARVVDEGQVVTAGGVTCGIDLGLHLVRRLEGDEVATAVEKQMQYEASSRGA